LDIKNLCLGLDIWVPQIVEARRRGPDFCHNTLEPVIDRSSRKEVAKRIRKHEIVFSPCLSSQLAHTVLLCLLEPEQLHNGSRKCKHSALIILRACLKTFDKNGGVGDNRKKQMGAGENASIPK
jgi:hypothetical protein